MEISKNKDSQYVEIDLFELFVALCKKAWVIAIVTILVGAIVGAYAFFFVTPIINFLPLMQNL